MTSSLFIAEWNRTLILPSTPVREIKALKRFSSPSLRKLRVKILLNKGNVYSCLVASRPHINVN